MEFTQSGKTVGFDVDLAQAVAQEIGKKILWVDVGANAAIPAVVSGKADAAVSAIYITDAHKQAVDFSDSYYAANLVALTKKDGPIKTLSDLKGKSVSVGADTESTNVLLDHYPDVKVMKADNVHAMFDLVNRGRVDAAVTGKPAAMLYAKNHPNMVVLPELIATGQYGIAISKQEPELTQEINRALKVLGANGTYKRLVDKWLEGPAN